MNQPSITENFRQLSITVIPPEKKIDEFELFPEKKVVFTSLIFIFSINGVSVST